MKLFIVSFAVGFVAFVIMHAPLTNWLAKHMSKDAAGFISIITAIFISAAIALFLI